MTIFKLYKDIVFKSSNWNIAVFQFCTPIQQRESIIHIRSVASLSRFWVCNHDLQQVRLPCPSPTPRACSNSCPSSPRYIQPSHPLLSLLLLPSIFPIGSFPVRRLSASVGQSIGVSASASVLPVNIQGWFPLGSTDLISLLSKGLSRIFSSNTVQKHQFFGAQLSSWSHYHIHTWLLEKPRLWRYGLLSAKWCLCF